MQNSSKARDELKNQHIFNDISNLVPVFHNYGDAFSFEYHAAFESFRSFDMSLSKSWRLNFSWKGVAICS